METELPPWRKQFAAELAEATTLVERFEALGADVNLRAAAIAHALVLVDLCAKIGKDPSEAIQAALALFDEHHRLVVTAGGGGGGGG